MKPDFEKLHRQIDYHANTHILLIRYMAQDALQSIAAVVAKHNRSAAQIRRWRVFNKLNR